MSNEEAVNELLMVKKGNSNVHTSVLYDVDNPSKDDKKYLDLKIRVTPSEYKKLIKGYY